MGFRFEFVGSIHGIGQKKPAEGFIPSAGFLCAMAKAHRPVKIRSTNCFTVGMKLLL